ncbi:MAG: hypothetical protein IT509_13165 [Rhodocyclaceae bacterium]|nr:hypothetical protein [Rhodocyclaceae bacterium]
MTSQARTPLISFALANSRYIGATINVFEVDVTTWKATTTLAPLYRDPTGTTMHRNPITLDGDGKWPSSVYVDRAVVCRVTGAAVPSHDTAIVIPNSAYNFTGDWQAGRSYTINDIARDGADGDNTGNLYLAGTFHNSSSSWSTDLADGLWSIFLATPSTSVPNIKNVRDFGAAGDGVTDDTAAFRLAMSALRSSGGGTFYIPTGTYIISATIFVPSGATVTGDGRGATRVRAAATWPEPGVAGQYAFFENDNWAETTITDTNIIIRDMTLDYADFGPVNPTGGGQHAIRMRFARYVTVANVEFQLNTAEDATAFRGVQDGLITGCFSYDALNCSYDHWDECQRCAVVGCYAEASAIAQMVNWNPERTGGPNVGRSSRGFVLANNIFKSTEASAAPLLLSPLVGGNYVSDITVTGNVFYNCYVVLRGGVTGASVTGNAFYNVAGGLSAIESYTNGGDAPVGIVITGNVITNPTTVIGNLGVIRAQVEGAVISSNAVVGSTYGVVPGIYCGTSAVILGTNYVSNGLIAASAGVINSTSSRVANNLQFGFYDTLGSVAHFRLQSDNNFVFYGTDGSGNPRTIWAVQQRSNTSSLILSPVVTVQNQLRQSISDTVAAAGTTRAGASATAGRYIVVTSCTAGVADGISLQDGAGSSQTIWNDTADTLKIYGASGSVTIDGGAAGASVSLAAGATASYTCISATVVRSA